MYRGLTSNLFLGLADPAALNQAVAAYQACHFIGMPECEVHNHQYTNT
jgi:replication-associated recombination protein RarA